jgi:hypothetical protein
VYVVKDGCDIRKAFGAAKQLVGSIEVVESPAMTTPTSNPLSPSQVLNQLAIRGS